MEERLSGRRGELLRLCLAARNWLLIQIPEDASLMEWKLSDDTRSCNEVVSHVAWSITAVCGYLSEELDIQLKSMNNPPEEEGVTGEIQQAYRLVKELLYGMTDEMLDRWSTLPPPARLREGSIETILRIIAGYHAFHHGGQVAFLVGRAKKHA